MQTSRARARRVAVIGLAAIAGVAVAGVRASTAGDAPEASAARSGSAGVRVYIDPETGRPGVPPPGAAAPSISATARRRAATMVEVPNTGPAGGVMINTKGRFNMDVMATDANGRAAVRCEPHMPEGAPAPGCDHE